MSTGGNGMQTCKGSRKNLLRTSSYDMQGVIKLIDAAKQAGVKKFVLQTSILTNGKAIGEGFNPVFLVLNTVTGALDKKLEVRFQVPDRFRITSVAS